MRRSARTIRCKLTDHRGIKATMVAQLDLDKAAPWSTDALSAGRLAEIRDLAQTLDVHRAIVAPGSAEGGEMLNLVRTLKAVGVRVSVLPRLLEVVGSSVEFDDLHGVTVMGVRRFELTRSSAVVKRSFDLLGASLGLLAVSPLLAVIAVAIKLDSRGPVFFRQLRVGQHGERFYMLKFRTMVPDAEALKDSLRDRNEAQEGLFKIADDPRVTRVGRFLRKSALDELPQLFNILKGEMSLVGPRPLVIEEDQRVEGWHRRRLELTPGMTGHWQILGPARVPLGGDGRDRLPVRRELVAVEGRQDPAAYRPARPRPPRALATPAAPAPAPVPVRRSRAAGAGRPSHVSRPSGFALDSLGGERGVAPDGCGVVAIVRGRRDPAERHEEGDQESQMTMSANRII